MTSDRREEPTTPTDQTVEEILRTPTPAPAATATLIGLLSALDAQHRSREKKMLGQALAVVRAS